MFQSRLGFWRDSRTVADVRKARADRARVRLLGACVAAAMLTPAIARAAPPFDTLGLDPESSGLANATVAFGRSIGVLQTNPALLSDVDPQAYVGFTLISPQLHARMKPKPSGTDVPVSIYDSDLGATAGVQDRALPTSELSQHRGDSRINEVGRRLGVGFASGFGIPKLRIGALFVVPLAGGSAADITTHYDDEREAAFSNRVHFMRFGEWQPVISATVGAAYQLLPSLQIGVSGELSATAIARLRVYIPDAAVQSYANTNLASEVSTKLRPIVGVRWKPLDWLAVGAVWRNESYFRVDGASEVTLWNQHEAGTDKTILKRTVLAFPIVFGYEPMQLALATGVTRGPVTAQIVATWHRWSGYLDQHGNKPQDAAAMPPSPYAQPSIDTSRYAFSDTVSLQGGVSWRYARGLEASIGSAWYPSPVPAQIGRTNYVDNTLLGFTAGHRHELHVFNRTFILSAALQLWVMLERITYKDPTQMVDEFPDAVRTLESKRVMPEAQGTQSNNPGFPGYRAGGWLTAASLSLAYPF